MGWGVSVRTLGYSRKVAFSACTARPLNSAPMNSCSLTCAQDLQLPNVQVITAVKCSLDNRDLQTIHEHEWGLHAMRTCS